MINSKGKLFKIKASLCNIPVNDNFKSLPGPTDRTGLLIVKLRLKENVVARRYSNQLDQCLTKDF